MNVLVFGGSGFLGSYLVNELENRGYSVTIADINKSDSKSNFIKCNISNPSEIDNLFNKNKYHFVYNLAGYANLDDAINNPIETLNLNVISNTHIIRNCVNHNVKRYLFASSTYAMSVKGSFYGISKLASEKIIEEYNKLNNLNFVIIRYGSVYSEAKFHNNYIYNLIESAVKNKEIIHDGSGEEFREYIHAIDAAKLSVDLLEDKRYLNKHVTLTGSQGIKRIDLFNMINEILGNNIIIKLNKKSKTNHYKYTPYSFHPSRSIKLNPNPQIDFGQGILDCIQKLHEK
tara:strand:- start:545 stop:1408 length:864 start_codon:yes stop_codon:yes gene_type:complete